MKLMKIVLLSASCAAAGPLVAQTTPELNCDTVRVVVPFGAGGGSDFQARAMVAAANKLPNAPQFQVVNITGQSGNRGTREVASADPDGCTLLYHHAAILSSYLTGRSASSWEAFAPVAMIAAEPALFAASDNENFTNLDELARFAAQEPGSVTAAVSVGSDTHFAMLMLQDALGVQFKIVGYDGTSERVTAMLSNIVQVGQVTEQTAAQYFGTELTPLAYAAKERSAQVPDIPTALEQGYDVVAGSVRGFLLPADTPEDIVNYYADIFETAVQDEDVVSTFEGIGVLIDYRGPEEYREWWVEASDRWEQLARDLNIYNPRD